MKPKNFLFVSIDALISDVAWSVQKEGHQVKYYIESEPDRDAADGFVPKTDDWEREVDWADVIVFDDVLGQGTKAERLRERGKAVIGGTRYTDRLEDDRAFGQEELKDAGVEIIPYREFTSFDDAIAYVKKIPDRYVIKPSGEAQNFKRLLFIGEEADGKDVIEVLEAYRKNRAGQIDVFQLQQRVTGVEVAVSAFFNGRRFMYPININFEHKKLFPGDIGPMTGEMGTLMYWSGPNRMFNATLLKMEQKLRDTGFAGSIDINCIVNKRGIYPLEFTARFGYPAITIQQEGLVTPIGELLYKTATGEMDEIRTERGFQVGVRIVVPPFPFDDKETFLSHSKNAAVLFKKRDMEGIHIEDVKCIDGQWFVAGESGVVLVVVGTGQTVRQAQKQVYKRISNVMIPGMYYRTDVGNRWFDDCDKLHTWGYLREA
jgi:phosphoribosylamine--glycine ligase